MSLKTFKENYKTFESRRKLVASYDRFLVDKRIAHEIVGPVGKPFFDNPSRFVYLCGRYEGEEIQYLNLGCYYQITYSYPFEPRRGTHGIKD